MQLTLKQKQADWLKHTLHTQLLAIEEACDEPVIRGLATLEDFLDVFARVDDQSANYMLCHQKFEHYQSLLALYLDLLGDEPVYPSRQAWLETLFFNPDGERIRGADVRSKTTMMGGYDEADPFYEPNWQMSSFKQSSFITNKDVGLGLHHEVYAKIQSNLKARFYADEHCDWQRWEKEEQSLTVSLESVPIEEFNSIFSAARIREGGPDSDIQYLADVTELFDRMKQAGMQYDREQGKALSRKAAQADGVV